MHVDHLSTTATDVYIWSTVEISVTVICACIPCYQIYLAFIGRQFVALYGYFTPTVRRGAGSSESPSAHRWQRADSDNHSDKVIIRRDDDKDLELQPGAIRVRKELIVAKGEHRAR